MRAVGTAARVGIAGAGPAGLIAAETLASAGVSVSVFDHRRSVGNKFLLAGRSGMNITNAEPIEELLDRYGPDRSFVESAVREWSPTDVQRWMQNLGQAPFVGSSGRVFPEAMRATPLLRAWVERLVDLGVSIEPSRRWIGFADEGGQLFAEVRAADAVTQVEVADAWLFALGGASWPRVGTDGSWVQGFVDQGIDVVPMEASNCGAMIEWSQVMHERFVGEPIKNIAVRPGGDAGHEDAAVRGDVMVTADGLEGGPVYAQSRALRQEFHQTSSATLVFDLHPDLSPAALEERLAKRRRGATATAWLRGAGLSPVKIALLREATANQLPIEPTDMAQLAKNCELAVAGLASVERAISTAGGIAQDELDASFMVRRCPGTFVAGEMIDWDAPTGGYLLQASLSMGVAAAHGVLAWLDGQSEPRPQAQVTPH